MLPISAGVLAGGKSTRMGCDKTHLLHGEQTFLSYLCAVLGTLSDDVAISVKQAADWPVGPYALAEDELSAFGPVEGIYQLLRRAKHPYLLVVAADMQNLTESFLLDFVARLQPEDRCMAVCMGDKIEPLCCVYHKDALPLLEEMRRTGVRRPRVLFSSLPTRYVDLSELGCSIETVSNLNTQDDYRAWLASRAECSKKKLDIRKKNSIIKDDHMIR